MSPATDFFFSLVFLSKVSRLKPNSSKKGISCLGTYIPGAFSKNDIINYISKIIRDYNKKNNKINVNEQILIKNNIKPFRNNIYDIYYNLYYANEWLIMNKFNK